MRFVQFYTPSINGTPIEGVGSSSVAYLDARFSLHNSALKAKELADSRKHVVEILGFDIRQGETFSRSQVVRKFEPYRNRK